MTTMKVIPKNVFAELPSTCDLSAEQIKFYDDNGYLVVKELIDFTSLYSYKQRFLQIAKRLVDKGNMTVVRDGALLAKGLIGEAAINKVQDILYDDIFSSYVEHPRLLHVVSQLIGEDLCAIHSMFINKPPSTGRHPPHQDMHYFPLEPPHYITASWTAVDHVTAENGSLYVIPGSHKPGILHQHGNLPDSGKLYHGILEEATVAPPGRRVPVEMSPGDTVFFHPLLVHGSGPNVTDTYRKSISCHYVNSARCRLRDVTSEQRGLASEVEAEAARRGARGAKFTDIFRYRSKQVKGFKSQL